MRNRKSIKRLLPLIYGCMLLLFSACKHDNLEIVKENENFRVATDFIKNNYDMTLFYAAVEKSGMAAELRGNGPFTVLVPSDAAFRDIGINNVADIARMDTDSLKGLVQRHLLSGRVLETDVPVDGVDIRYRTLGGTDLYATHAVNSKYGTLSETLLYFNGARVMRKDVSLANGTLHVLNKVMKYKPKTTVQDWLASRPEYSIFVSGLKKFGLWDKLATAGPYTVFAPQNKVFEASGISAATIAALNTTTYSGARLFGAYIYEKKHFFISDFYAFSQMSGESFYTRQIDHSNWYVTVGISNEYSTGNLGFSLQVRTALLFPYEQFNSVQGGPPALTDHLTDNGLVHDMTGLVVLPDQAINN